MGARRSPYQHLGRLLFGPEARLVGIYQHVDKKHLDRYLAEFEFRQNTREKLGINDERRAELALQGFPGKRLTYQTTHSPTEA
jgi:hypothetical protein